MEKPRLSTRQVPTFIFPLRTLSWLELRLKTKIMKKNTLLLLLALCLSNFTFAQSNFISEYYADYETDDSFDKLSVTSKTFDLITEVEPKNKDERNAIEAISKLDGIKVLHKEKTEGLIELRTEAIEKAAQDERYEDLIKVETQNENFLLMIREEAEIVKELTVIAGDKDHFMMATLYGEIDLKNISRLASAIQNNGKEWFKVFENIDSNELVFNGAKGRSEKRDNKANSDDISFNVYPNPVSDYVQLEAIGGTETEYQLEFFSIMGEPVKNVGKVALPYKVQLEDLPSGAYFLRLTNAEGVFKNFRIVKP